MPPRIAAEYSPHHLAFDDGRQVESALPPEIDGEAENLADHANITPKQAAAAIDWMRARELEEIRRAAGDIVGRLFAEIVPRAGKIDPRLVGLRFLATSFLLNKSGETLTSLASRIGVSKQLADYHANWVGDRLQFKGFTQKRAAARLAYSAAQRTLWAKLTPEERRLRRAGKKAQSATPAAQI